MNEVIYFAESAVSKSEMVNVSDIHERVKKEQITQMFVPKMKELNLG
jgi:hypothetical protein